MNILLILVFFISALIRLQGINWDQGNHLHPDERAIIMATLPLALPTSMNEFFSPDSPLNPHFFAYGNFPFYLLKASSLIAYVFDTSFNTYNGIELVGRFISIIADLITIFLIFKIARILFNDKIGVASAFIYGISVFAIQASHFFAVDTLLTLFITLTLLCLLRFYKSPSLKNAAYVGASFGLALSTKISAVALILSILISICIDFAFVFMKHPHKINLWSKHIPLVLKRLIKEGVVIILFTGIVFALSQPYALIDFKEFIKQNLLQSQMTHNPYIFPYTLQYVGKIPFVYEIKNIFFWGQGPVIFSICFLGIVYFLTKLRETSDEKRAQTLIVLSFMIIYFLVVGKFAVGWMRYMLPIYPILSIFGGYFLVSLLKHLGGFRKTFKYVGYVVIFLAMFAWPASFMSIYQKPHSRVTATNWINKNIPQGSTIATEHWDDRLPLHTTNQYKFIELNLYDLPDDENKWIQISQKIKSANYIILSSNRLYVPLQKLSDCYKFKVCYPLANQYYNNLFSESLGFERVAEFTSYPSVPFLNTEINDQGADESFTVYDHPRVLIYKNKQL